MKDNNTILQSAAELVRQDCRDAYGHVTAFDKHEVAENSLVFHPDLLHDAQTLLVSDDIVRLDAMQTQISETEPQNGAERLWGDLLAPAFAVEHVADFGGIRLKIERGEPAGADHSAGRPLDHRPVTVVAAFIARKNVSEEFDRIALVVIRRPGQVLRDLGIACVVEDVGPVALFEFAERQASRFEGGRVSENPFQLFFVRDPSLPSLYLIYFTIKGTRVQHFFELTDKNFRSIILGTVCLMAKIF